MNISTGNYKKVRIYHIKNNILTSMHITNVLNNTVLF